MLRLVFFLVVSCVLAWTAVWVVNHPGTVVVQWLDQELILSVGTVIAVLLAFAGRSRRPVRAAARGLLGLPSPLAQLARPPAAGARLRGADPRPDGGRRRRPQRRARASPPGRAPICPDNGSLLLLRRRRRSSRARRRSRTSSSGRCSIAATPSSSACAACWRRHEDRRYDEALTLARRAYRRSPTTPWVLTTLFELLARAGEWDEALPLVDELQAQKLLDDGAGQAQEGRSAPHAGDAGCGSRTAPPTRWPRRATRGQGRARVSPRRRSRRPSWPSRRAAGGWRCSCSRTAGAASRTPTSPAPTPRSTRTRPPSQRLKRIDTAGPARTRASPETLVLQAELAMQAGEWGTARSRLEAASAPVRRPASTGCWPRSSGSRGGDRGEGAGMARPGHRRRARSRLGLRRHRARCCPAGSPWRPAAASTPSIGRRRPSSPPCFRPRRPPTSCRAMRRRHAMTADARRGRA